MIKENKRQLETKKIHVITLCVNFSIICLDIFKLFVDGLMSYKKHKAEPLMLKLNNDLSVILSSSSFTMSTIAYNSPHTF